MKKMIYALSTIGLACAFNANAIEVYKSDKNTVSIGGDVSVILQNVDHQGTTTIEDNTSKINFGFTHKLPDDWQVAAFFEWAINVVGKANLAIADGIIAADEDSDYLTNRQGYIQVSHDTYGSLTLGKQWGVWYDVVGPTDNEEVWGGEATGAYTYDGDGGVDGTGRADKAIVYRNQFGQISIGLQAQLKQDSFQTETNIFDDQPSRQQKSISMIHMVRLSLMHLIKTYLSLQVLIMPSLRLLLVALPTFLIQTIFMV